MKADGREVVNVDIDVVQAIIKESAKVLSPEQAKVLHELLETHVEVVRLLRQKGTTILRLRRLFGLRKTERLEAVLGEPALQVDDKAPVKDTGDALLNDSMEHASDVSLEREHDEAASGSAPTKKPRRPKGSGRRAAADYEGPEIFVPHAKLRRRDVCECKRGRLYPSRSVVIPVIRGQSPLAADKYRLQTLRCNACGALYKAEPPAEAQGPKYRPSSIAILAALHYTFGMPFYRQGKLQELLGVPVPVSTQWKLMNESEPMIRPALEALERHAAMSHLFHIDDTYLQLLNETVTNTSPLRRPPKQVGPGRTGRFTTGILAVDREGHRVALFMTGRQHAGENMVDLMKLRPPGLHPPIIMSDALSRNTAGLFGLMMAYYAYCLAHARRGVVDQLENFPDEAKYVLQELARVFQVDKRARKLGLTGRQKKLYHQKHSQPVLKALKAWIQACFKQRRIEPNGKALRYILRHWRPLTLFLRQPDAPLTNNACERLLKVAIRYRKNSYFYRSPRGAEIGDTYMSLAYTAEINGKNPVDDLTALLEHPAAVAADPDAWLPWTYEATRAQIAAASAPPSESEPKAAVNA